MLNEYEKELVKEILFELEKIESKTLELERIKTIALILIKPAEAIPVYTTF